MPYTAFPLSHFPRCKNQHVVTPAYCRDTRIVSSMASVGQPCLDGWAGLTVTFKCWASSKSVTYS